MDQVLKEQMRKKFDICYVMTKENIAFRKYAALHELETHHGVDLGPAYKTKDSAKNFTHSVRSPTYRKSIRAHSNLLARYNGKFYGNIQFP